MIQTSRFLLQINMKEVHAWSACYSKDNLIHRVFHLPTPSEGAREEKDNHSFRLNP